MLFESGKELTYYVNLHCRATFAFSEDEEETGRRIVRSAKDKRFACLLLALLLFTYTYYSVLPSSF